MRNNEYFDMLIEVETLIKEEKYEARKKALRDCNIKILALKKQIEVLESLKDAAKNGDWRPIIKNWANDVYELEGDSNG